MKILKAFVCSLLLTAGNLSAQTSPAPKDWTPWLPTVGDWAEFYVFTNFRGGNKSPEQLAKKNLKSLKVVCIIAGRIAGDVPDTVKGVTAFSVLYREYGTVEGVDFGKESRIVYYSKKGQLVPVATIVRSATQFDVDEAGKPSSEAKSTTELPSFIRMLGADNIQTKISGRRYRVPAEWRRKGNTVEILLKDYAPASKTLPDTN